MIGNINESYIHEIFGENIKFKIRPGDCFDRITFIKSDKYKSVDIVHTKGSLIDIVTNLVDYAIIRILNSTNENTNLHLSNLKRCLKYIFSNGFAGLTQNEQNNIIKIFAIFVEEYMTVDLANKIITSWELADNFKTAFSSFFDSFDSFQMCKDFLKFFIDNLDNQKFFWDNASTSMVVEDRFCVRNLHICDLSRNLISLDDYFYNSIRDKSDTIWNGTYYVLVDAISK